MTDIKTIAITDVHAGERVRPVDDAEAEMLAVAIGQEGLLQPIAVRFTPNGKRKYTLVAGALRLRAFQMLGRGAIACTLFKGDAAAAKRAEIIENLARADLTVLARAQAIAAYRKDWEDTHGPINPDGGRPKKNTVNLTEFCSSGGFADHVADRMLCSKSAIERLMTIARKLPEDLCDRLHGTAIANHQAALLGLARLPASILANAAKVYDLVAGDFDQLMDALDPQPKQSEAQKLRSRIIDTWGRMRPDGRLSFVRDHRAEIEAALAKLDAESKTGGAA